MINFLGLLLVGAFNQEIKGTFEALLLTADSGHDPGVGGEVSALDPAPVVVVGVRRGVHDHGRHAVGGEGLATG